MRLLDVNLSSECASGSLSINHLSSICCFCLDIHKRTTLAAAILAVLCVDGWLRKVLRKSDCGFVCTLTHIQTHATTLLVVQMLSHTQQLPHSHTMNWHSFLGAIGKPKEVAMAHSDNNSLSLSSPTAVNRLCPPALVRRCEGRESLS